MSSRGLWIPEDLPPAFSVRTAIEAGLTRSQLRHPSLVHPAYGARCLDAAEDLAGRGAALAPAIVDDWAYSHITAARLWGLPVAGDGSGEALHIVRRYPAGQIRRPGVVGHRGLESRRIVEREGLPVTDLVCTWADLAALVHGEDLVVVADAVLRRNPELAAPLRMASAVRRRRGARALREAAGLMRMGSGSPMETRARLAFVAAGLPEPELNAEIIEDGEWLARADFAWRAARVIVEYEGDHHRSDRRQWQLDITRVRLLEAAGWCVIRITSADLRGAAFDRLIRQLHRLVKPHGV